MAVTADPLVSVITPTWNRPVALSRAIASVWKQTYKPVEHIIVSDGPDQAFIDSMGNCCWPHIWYDQLPEKDPFRWGHLARMRGLEMAEGEFIAWLDDDNAFRPHHLELIVKAIIEKGAGFGYGMATFHDRGDDYNIGCPPPQYGQIDTSMIVHRKEILEFANFRDDGQETIDWDLADRWMRAGVGWAFVPEVTVDNYQTRE